MDINVIGMLDIKDDTIRVYSYNPDSSAGLELEEAVVYECSFESLLDFIDNGKERGFLNIFTTLRKQDDAQGLMWQKKQITGRIWQVQRGLV